MIKMVATLLLVPAVAVAETRLEMKRGGNVIDVSSCTNRSAEVVTVTVDLRDDRKLEVVANGTQSDRRASSHQWREGCISHEECYETLETTAWSTRWTGRWTMTRDTLTLDLVLAKDSCKHVETPSQVQPRLLCKAASKQTRVTCVRADDAWRCNGPGIGQSPLWVLSPKR